MTRKSAVSLLQHTPDNLMTMITTQKFILRFILLFAVFAAFSLTASAQEKNTCIINGKVQTNCTQLPSGQCLINNQLPVKCDAQLQTKLKCADGGPLIIKISEATTFKERSVGYFSFNENLKCREINVGFFGAAGDVTSEFNKSEIFTKGFSEIADKFLAKMSNDLLVMNTVLFKEIVDTGKLKTRGNKGFITDGVGIDTELVDREQIFVEAGLKKDPNRHLIVGAINERIKGNLDAIYSEIYKTPITPSMRAIAQVRDKLREVDPNAEYDYGNINHRQEVGYILAKRHRK